MFEGHTDVVTEGDGLDRRPVRRRRRRRPPVGTRRGRHEGRAGGDALRHRRPAAPRARSPAASCSPPSSTRKGMMLGAKDLVARGRTDGVDGVICCEPEGGEICHVAKGALRLRIDLTGKMAHGAMPFQGRNPNRGRRRGDRRARRARAAPCRTRYGEHPHLGQVWITPTVLRRRRAGADERDAGRRVGVGRRAHDPRRRPRRPRRRAGRRSSRRRRSGSASTSTSP